MFRTFTVDFPTLMVPPTQGYSLESRHGLYEHETITIKFMDSGVTYDSISDGTPATIAINGVNGTRQFNGYVHHITPDISPSKNYVDITFIGASKVFKQQSQRVWTNATADQVIADLATSHGFSYIAVPHARVFDQISQSSMSDWEMMVKLAKQCGYILKANNTNIIFQPLTQDYTESRHQAAYYLLRGLDSRHTGIYSFSPMIGEYVPYQDSKKASTTIAGVNRESAVAHSHTNQGQISQTRKNYIAPIYDHYSTDVVAPSYSIAQYEAAAADERARFAYRGDAVVVGSPTLFPGDPVFLDGLGHPYTGYWTVLSVRHHALGNSEYSTAIEVGTDSLGTSIQWTDSKSIANPSSSIQRVITPGVRQKNVVPVTSLNKNGNSVKESSKTPYSQRKTTTKVNVPSRPAYVWRGAGGNLKTPITIEPKTSPGALDKMRAFYGR